MISEASNPQRHSHLKSITSAWRERLLNKWDDLSHWADVFTWRMQTFLCVQNAVQAPELLGGLSRTSDHSWTVIKLAQVARKQQLPSTCLMTLAKLLPTVNLDVQESFLKLREQIKTCLQSPSELNTALSIISSTNLDLFLPEQRAELFRLKGEALQHLGYGDESNTAYSACLSICDTFGKGWLSWALFCDRVFSLKKDIQWADHALVCTEIKQLFFFIVLFPFLLHSF